MITRDRDGREEKLRERRSRCGGGERMKVSGKVIRGGEGGVGLDGESLRAMRGVPTGQQVQLCM